MSKAHPSAVADVATLRLSSATGRDFFVALADHLATTTGAREVVIARFVDLAAATAQIVSRPPDGDADAGPMIPLAGTPLEELLRDDFCVIAANADQIYPQFQLGHDEPPAAFAGIALRTSDGELQGLIASLHAQPIAEPSRILDACRFFAARAAEELARSTMVDRLRRSEERFKSLAKATADAVWDCDLNVETTGQGGAMPATGVHHRIHKEDRARVAASLSAAIEGRDVYWQEEYRLEKDVGIFSSILDRAVITRDPSGRAVRIVGGMTDISDRMESASRLREQAELLDRASDAIIVYDLQHRIQYWNRGAERLFGWEAQESIGRDVLELFESSREDIQHAAAQARENDEWSAEISKTDKQGREHVLSSRWTLIRGPSGEPRAFLNIDTDITENKQLQAQFLRTQRLESIGVLAGGIAHDLNNMLTPITMSVDMLKRMHPEKDSARLLDSIESCAQRGADLVRQVLGFARGVDGKRLLVNPGFIAGDIAKIARDTFSKSIRVFLQCARAPWLITGDATQLHQVLLNLCVNARDAMPAGGELRIKVDNNTFENLIQGVVGTAPPGDYASMTVSDTGSGIPEEILDKIFDPFFTTKPPGLGTGLGLSTLLAIVKSHGGTVTMQTKSGEGSSFTVYIPAEKRKGARRNLAVMTDLPRGNGELLLVVDDEFYIRTIAKQTLEGYGYEVVTAANGAEALTAFLDASSKVALVLTDMMMPVMDGPALIQALRRVNHTLPILAASGMSAEAMTDRARIAGATDFVAKPYTAEDLLTRIAMLVSKR